MLKRLYLLILTLLLFFCSCENKWPDNGDLDGMWQLMTIERNDSLKQVKQDKLYWSIRSNLVQLSCIDGDKKYSHFRKLGSTLTLYDLCYYSNNATAEDNNEWIMPADAHVLARWGIEPYAATENYMNGPLMQTFRIENLSSSKMILKAENYKLIFRKF
jgi:hypothetical protein